MAAHDDKRSLSRRAFLKGAGSLAAALTLESLNGQQASASAGTTTGVSENAKGVLIDLTRCVGCCSCVLACKEAHGLPVDRTAAPNCLSAETLTFIDQRDVPAGDRPADNGEALSVKRQCMHCVQPACASACTVGALRKTPEGPVVYDASKCIGCRYCQYACPFGVPKFEWQETLGLISKCDMCVDRLDDGLQPACVSQCPTGALKFGKRSKLLAEAKGRIEANPDRYVDHVYGEYEVGGTSMLYLSAVPFDEIGFPTLSSQPIPHYAEFVMKQTPVVALTVASAASGLCWLCKRREDNVARVQAVDEEAGK